MICSSLNCSDFSMHSTSNMWAKKKKQLSVDFLCYMWNDRVYRLFVTIIILLFRTHNERLLKFCVLIFFFSVLGAFSSYFYSLARDWILFFLLILLLIFLNAHFVLTMLCDGQHILCCLSKCSRLTNTIPSSVTEVYSYLTIPILQDFHASFETENNLSRPLLLNTIMDKVEVVVKNTKFKEKKLFYDMHS